MNNQTNTTSATNLAIQQRAQKNISDILNLALLHTPKEAAIIVYDDHCALSKLLSDTYRYCLPQALFINFYQSAAADIQAAFKTLKPRELVVLIQSSSFRLDAFRLRVELFKDHLKVIEHPHLARMQGVELEYYIDSLAYDPAYYQGIGLALQKRLMSAKSCRIDSQGEILRFEAGLEDAKLNIGDYRTMLNIGGQFPIGEVFTESRDLEAVNGRVRIFAFADTSFSVNKPEKPLTLIIDKGRVTAVLDSTPEFDRVLANIRADEGDVWLRELGFGLNRAFTPERLVTDIGTYERICGIHLSLGKKHGVYKKPGFRRADTWHHVDVFAVSHLVYLDEELIFQKGHWQVS